MRINILNISRKRRKCSILGHAIEILLLKNVSVLFATDMYRKLLFPKCIKLHSIFR